MSRSKALWKFFFIAYMSVLVIFVVVKFDGSMDSLLARMRNIEQNRDRGNMNMNLVPFDTISRYRKNITSSFAIYNFLGNIIPFLPMGFIMLRLIDRPFRFMKSIFACVLTILLLETAQLVFMFGYFDVDDIILNMLGVMLGYLFFVIWD